MKTFEWCGYHWATDMKGRKIHPDQPWMWYDDDAVYLTRDNIIELFTKHKSTEITYEGKTYNPSMATGTIISTEDFDYGTFSAEIMMPIGRNLWPAFWLSGSGNWPPEIDIAEAWSNDNSYYFRFTDCHFPWIYPSWRVTTNMHYRDEQLNKTDEGSRNMSIFKQPKEPSEYFIEYKCKWEPERITFYANNKIVREIKGYQCVQLTKNLKDPERGYKMNVIFDAWCENPDKCKVDMIQPLLIKNFKYEPL